MDEEDSHSSHASFEDIRVLKAQRIGGLGRYIVLCRRPDDDQYLGKMNKNMPPEERLMSASL